MNEEKNIITETVQQDESATLIKFSKPYKFEGEAYTEIDLAGLDELTSMDMIAAEKHLMRSGVFSPLPETTTEYTQFMASRATGQPIEFFQGLPPKDAVKLKNRVTSFFYGED